MRLSTTIRAYRGTLRTGSSLILRYWQSMELYANQTTIATIAKYAPTNRAAVRRDLKELESLGYLEHVRTLPDRREHYRFTLPEDADVSIPVEATTEAAQTAVAATESAPRVELPAEPVFDDIPALPNLYDDPWGMPPAKAEPIVPRTPVTMPRREFGKPPVTAAPLSDDEPPF